MSKIPAYTSTLREFEYHIILNTITYHVHESWNPPTHQRIWIGLNMSLLNVWRTSMVTVVVKTTNACHNPSNSVTCFKRQRYYNHKMVTMLIFIVMKLGWSCHATTSIVGLSQNMHYYKSRWKPSFPKYRVGWVAENLASRICFCWGALDHWLYEYHPITVMCLIS